MFRSLYAGDQSRKRFAINQCNPVLPGELLRFARESARGDDDCRGRLPGDLHTQQFPHDWNTYLACLPLLGLYQCIVAILCQYQINAAVRTGSGVTHRISLPAICFGKQLFERLPRH